MKKQMAILVLSMLLVTADTWAQTTPVSYTCVAGDNYNITPSPTGSEGAFGQSDCLDTLLPDGSSISWTGTGSFSCYEISGSNWLILGLDPAGNQSTGSATWDLASTSHHITDVSIHSSTQECDPDWIPGATTLECELSQFDRTYEDGTNIYGVTTTELTGGGHYAICGGPQTGDGITNWGTEDSCLVAGDVYVDNADGTDGDDFYVDWPFNAGTTGFLESFTITDQILGVLDENQPIGTDYQISVSWVCTPGIIKEFADDTLDPGETTTLTIILYNGQLTTATGSTFTDTLPADLEVDSSGTPTNTCGGTLTASGQNIDLTGGTIPAANEGTQTPGQCVITIPVKAKDTAAGGTATNTIPKDALVTSTPSQKF